MTQTGATLTKDQYAFLCSPLHEQRVNHKQGQSHLEAWDVRRHLIRCFGFGGYDTDKISTDLIREIEHKPTDPNGKSRWTVIYRAEVRLTVKRPDGSELAHWDDGATGDGCNLPSLGDAHDFALKTAYSQALKRCAVNLGDQFGLCLYNGGDPAPVVLRSLVAPADPGTTQVASLPVDDAPVRPEPAPVQPDDHPTAAPTPPDQVAAKREARKASRDQLKALHTVLTKAGITDRDQGLQYISMAIGHDVSSSKELTPAEAAQVINKARAYLSQQEPEAVAR